MTATLSLFVVGFGRPDLLREQKRLFDKYLKDRYEICVVDNSDDAGAGQIEAVCRNNGMGYMRCPSPGHEHNAALNMAANAASDAGCEYWMTVDHDIFPRRKTRLIAKIKQAGFFGIGQWHTPTSSRYLWPGFAGFSRQWLNGRVPNFNGIRGVDKRDDGDCGSMLHILFQEGEWEKMPRAEHGYIVIRPEDEYGLQSYGVEFFDDFLHLTNASHWMDIPDPIGRDRILAEMIKCL